MKKEIGITAYYAPEDDLYMVHKRGYAIQNFNTSKFYEQPKPIRRQALLALMKVGLTHNIGEKGLDVEIGNRYGIKIV